MQRLGHAAGVSERPAFAKNFLRAPGRKIAGQTETPEPAPRSRRRVEADLGCMAARIRLLTAAAIGSVSRLRDPDRLKAELQTASRGQPSCKKSPHEAGWFEN
jgi:hypothetical protein